MKVVLIHPPHPNSTDDRLDPPMGLLYIAAHLEKNGIDVEVTDLSGIEKGGWGIPRADIYGITSYIATLNLTKQIAAQCKAVNPQSKVIIGGAHASVRPDDFPYADKVVRGYGEAPMLSLCGKSAPVDLFTFPAFNLVDLKTYSRRISGEPSIPFLTSRGCPFKCTFCGLATMHEHSRYKMMSPTTAANQFYKIKHEMGINRLNFQDDIFTMGRTRLFEILKHVKANDFRFRCMGRSGMDNEEVYKQLADAGCEQVAWGIESGSQYILDRMKKQVKVKDNYDVIQWAKKYGIVSRAFFIIGFPGETRETLEETKRFIEWADPDQFFVSSFVPYPGTDVADNLEKYGITNISYDYNQYYQVSRDGTGGLTIDTEWLTREQFRELELEFREWIKSRGMRGAVQDYESQHNNPNV
jgi:anaerobic magnesium-protoporphyrin IX monomethyl ester cyclase